jgi:hypothetical protein
MELFLPSVIVLLLAAAVVFFLLPQFGPATLAVVSAALLGLGLYQHYTTFGTEYRFSTWQLVSFSPYLLMGGLFVVIAIFLLYTIPVSGPAVPNVDLPTISNMPSANTSTNGVTEFINNSLNTAANLFNGNSNAANGNGIFTNMANTFNRNVFGKNTNRGYKGLNFPFSQV